jgi:DNA repair protein RadA
MTLAMEKELTLEDLPGVGAATAEKLYAAGFSDVMGIAVASPAALSRSSRII